MKQPTYYSGVIHSFLNAASFKGRNTNYHLSKLLVAQRFKGCETEDKAGYMVVYYCHINKDIKRPSNLTHILLLNKVS